MALVLVAACGDDGEKDNSETLAWLGATNHFRAVGTLNGETLDLTLDGADANDTTKLWCKREWVVPLVGGTPDYANGQMVEFKIDALVTVGGANRRIELEHKKHDFQRDAVGTVVTVVPRDDAADPLANQMWSEWEWYDAADANMYEQAAQSGTFTLKLFEGAQDATGLIIPENTGRVGGFLEAKWSQTEQMTVSFTVNCTANAVEEVQ